MNVRMKPDFMRGANNVYRTKKFIVKQVLTFTESSIEDNAMISFDTYYKRTISRDFYYNLEYKNKSNIEGKRMPSTAYKRQYVN